MPCEAAGFKFHGVKLLGETEYNNQLLGEVLMPEERKPFGTHKVTLENRERLTVTGVTDVVSFDEECVVCETGMGMLVFKGGGMKVSSLSVGSGDLTITGSVDSMVYETGLSRKTKGSMFGKIFK